MEICSSIIKRRIMRLRITLLIVAATLAAAALLCLAFVFRNVPGVEIIFFIALFFSLLILIFLLLHTLRANEKYSKVAKVLQRCFLICLAVGVAGFLILQGLILSAALTEDAEVDCIIILGAGLYGETPSRILVSRLDAGLEYLSAWDDVPIIVSGGQGPGESITEAEAMRRYLVRRGADESLIWKEESSTSTWENLSYSLALMEENGLDVSTATIAIVTNEFHLYRAKHIAGTMGINAVGVSAQTPYPTLRLLYHVREVPALLKDFLLGAGVLVA